MAKHLDTYDYQDIEFQYEYEAGEPMIHTYSNGDPGHPGCGPSVNIYKAMFALDDINGNKIEVDILPLLGMDVKEVELCDLDLDTIEEKIIEYRSDE